MKDFLIGMSGHDPRRTKIVAQDGNSQAPNPNEPQVLVTRTLTVRTLVPLSAYEPATVQGAREYEIDLPEGEQVQAVIEAVGTVDDIQVEFSVRVDEASPDFTFEALAKERADRKARGQFQHGQGN